MTPTDACTINLLGSFFLSSRRKGIHNCPFWPERSHEMSTCADSAMIGSDTVCRSLPRHNKTPSSNLYHPKVLFSRKTFNSCSPRWLNRFSRSLFARRPISIIPRLLSRKKRSIHAHLVGSIASLAPCSPVDASLSSQGFGFSEKPSNCYLVRSSHASPAFSISFVSLIPG